MTSERLVQRLAGAVWGHLIGDAVGVPYEFEPASRIGEVRFGATGSHGQPPGTWSDDGSLMLALLDSLLSVCFDPHDQATRALAWRDDYLPISPWGMDPEAWRKGLSVLEITAILYREDRRSARPLLEALGDRLDLVARHGPAVLYRVRR